MENKKKKQKRNRRIAFIFLILLTIFFIFIIFKLFFKEEKTTETTATPSSETLSAPDENSNTITAKPKEITDWRLRLANIDHILPEDFTVELANFDSIRQFDKRAIEELTEMINDAKKDGISNFWVQSSYRSITKQKQLYENSIQKYKKQGKSQEEAEKQTLLYINKPGASDHNLGLAVDFNYVNDNFEKNKAFTWLQKNAENYGFILRYPKEKEEITKIAYEPWHWRYVGQEHAKTINELNFCLEEYIEYLQLQNN